MSSSETAETITAFKGFDADWKCRGFQYAVAQTFEHAGEAKACESGFHACEHPLNVFAYYPPAGSRFAVVEQSGTLSRHGDDTKVASSRISIKAEIDFAGLVKAAIEYTVKRCKPVDADSPERSTGDQGAASSTGNQGAASSTGYQGAASSTGYRGAAMACGPGGRVMGARGNALFLVERDDDGEIVHAWAGIVGRDGIKASVFYMLQHGKPVEVDA